MAFEKAPAFQFYASDFRADAKVSAMTFEEVGVYILLLTFCWTEGAIPSDPKALARLLKTDVRTIERVWPALAPCFTNQGENYIQERMERERAKLAAYRQRAATKGTKGATARWQKHGAGNATEMPVPSDTDATGIAQAKPSDGSSSSSSSSDNPQPPVGAVVPDMPDSLLVDAALAAKAARLFEGWPEVYAKARSGAWPRKAESRDWPNALDLVHAYPDVDRLLLMADVFLRRSDIGPKNVPGTLGQFAHMAPDCDRLLREHGR